MSSRQDKSSQKVPLTFQRLRKYRQYSGEPSLCYNLSFSEMTPEKKITKHRISLRTCIMREHAYNYAWLRLSSGKLQKTPRGKTQPCRKLGNDSSKVRPGRSTTRRTREREKDKRREGISKLLASCREWINAEGKLMLTLHKHRVLDS